jgi:hypothetical protein
MNSFTKGLLTGVFVIVVGLLLSGSRHQSSFQLSTTMEADGIHIFETILDTRSGKVVSREKVYHRLYKIVKTGD